MLLLVPPEKERNFSTNYFEIIYMENLKPEMFHIIICLFFTKPCATLECTNSGILPENIAKSFE